MTCGPKAYLSFSIFYCILKKKKGQKNVTKNECAGSMPWSRLFHTFGRDELSNGILCPSQEFFCYIEALNSRMFEKLQCPKRNTGSSEITEETWSTCRNTFIFSKLTELTFYTLDMLQVWLKPKHLEHCYSYLVVLMLVTANFANTMYMKNSENEKEE